MSPREYIDDKLDDGNGSIPDFIMDSEEYLRILGNSATMRYEPRGKNSKNSFYLRTSHNTFSYQDNNGSVIEFERFIYVPKSYNGNRLSWSDLKGLDPETRFSKEPGGRLAFIVQKEGEWGRKDRVITFSNIINLIEMIMSNEPLSNKSFLDRFQG